MQAALASAVPVGSDAEATMRESAPVNSGRGGHRQGGSRCRSAAAAEDIGEASLVLSSTVGDGAIAQTREKSISAALNRGMRCDSESEATVAWSGGRRRLQARP
jgi:hypothetical protein